MKVLRAILASILFLPLLLGFYWIHVQFFRVNVLLYSAILDGVLATVVAAVLLLTSRRMSVFSGFEKTQLIVIWLLGAYIFAISIPTVIDRSLSFYILEKLQQRGGGIRLDAFEQVFTKEYVKEHRLVAIRLTEQRNSGTLIIDHGCVRLTPRGEELATFSRFFRAHLLPRHRLLMNEYSDALVDPFKGSQVSPDYVCH